MTYFDERKNPPARNAVDRFIRRFGTAAWAIAVAFMYAIAATAAGIALVPALAMFERWGLPLWHAAAWWRLPAVGIVLAACVGVWGLTLMAIVPVYNWLLPTRIKPFKGGYFTIAALPWYVHNALFYLVRFTVLPFATLTPLGPLFLQAMGMTLGKRVRIGTDFLSDVRLITIGDDAAIGGSATMFCHVAGGGHLIIAPLVIGKRAQIGLKATVMGDVVIGDDAVVLANSVVLPGTRIGAGERWGGVPARRISAEEWKDYTTNVLHRA
jgi:acetyltransferase-like isoleucine patch superfamily enzyme